MLSSRNLIVPFLLSAVLIASSCADLKQINSFSSTANKTVISYNDVGYNFSNSYYKYTLTQSDYDFPTQSRNVIGFPKAVIDTSQLNLAKKTDDVISLYVTGISAYFQGLSKLSDKTLVDYNFDAITNKLKSDTTLKKHVGITDDKQVDAVSGITKTFTDEITRSYRQKKLKEIMTTYDDSVSISISTLQTIITKTLVPNINIDKGLLQTKYRTALINPDISLDKKIDLLKDYSQERTVLSKSQEQLEQIVKGLEKIKKGHHAVVVELKKSQKLTSKNIITLINSYNAEVYQVYKNIKSLT